MFRVKMQLFSLLLVFCLCNAQTAVTNITAFHVGVILELDSLVGRIGMTSLALALSDFYSANPNHTTELVIHVRDSHGDVIDAAESALNLMKDVDVDAIIGPQKSAEASFVAGLGNRANVPIISFSATSPSLQWPYFFQAAVDDAAQVEAITSVVRYFNWNEVVLIFQGSDSGMVPYLSNSLQENIDRISYRSSMPDNVTDDYILQELYKMKTMETRVFVVHMSISLASRLFLKAKEAGMMSEGYAWIVTSDMMDLLYSFDSPVIKAMEGVIGVKPMIPRSTRLTSAAKRWKLQFLQDNPEYSQAELSLFGIWAYDALWAVATAAEKVRFREPTSSRNISRAFGTEASQTGLKLREALSEVAFEGLGGQFQFADGLILQPTAFQILNVVGDGVREVGIWTTNGIQAESNTSDSRSNKKLKNVIFPGDSTVVPIGWQLPVSGKKLRLGVPVAAGFPEFVHVEKDPQTNATKVTGCFIDMFEAVIAAMPYAVRYEYVPFEKHDGSTAGNYDEFAYQVYLENYDGAVGDIAITSKRSKYVDFTLPFTAGGIDMVVRTMNDDPNSRWVFLKPLTKELWLCAIALFILTGLALWILEHKVNSAYRGTISDQTGMALYNSFMSMVYAQREKIVNNLSRLVIVVWLFVVMILNSTYTASLSARLTVQRMQPVVTDATLLIRRGDYVGCHKGSFICDRVKELGFDESKIRGYEFTDDIDDALAKGNENGGISALFSVKPYTNLFLIKYCGKYTTAGPTYPTEGFAYVFQRGSPLVADVSRAVIELTENGKLSAIQRQWFKQQECTGQDNTVTSSVSLKSFETLFAITGGITATCVLVFLAKYVYTNRDVIKRIVSNSSTTLWSKIRAIGKHFDERDPKSFPSSKLRDDGSFRFRGSSTVVPVDIEMDEVNGDDGTNLEHVEPVSQTRSDLNLESIIDIVV